MEINNISGYFLMCMLSAYFMSRKEYFEYLESGISKNSINIAVIGLGYVGLPTALAFHSQGFKVLGIDNSEDVISCLNSGFSHLSNEYNLQIPSDARWSISKSYKCIQECDIVIICVPTPVNSAYEPDLSMVHSAFKEVSNNTSDSKNLTIILESTVQPGTTNNCFEMFFGNKANSSLFNVAYCPERISPGDPLYGGHNMDRIIGSNNNSLTEILAKLYKTVNNSEIHPVKSIEVAEAAKLVENTQRDIDIAFVNELAILMPKLGVDVEDVLDAASTKWNFHRHTPGIGVGGHCIPIDPHYYIEIAKKHNVISNLSPNARRLNESMPEYTSTEILKICDGKSNSRILIFGYSYKPNIGDVRETPIAPLITNLSKNGAKIFVWDPYVNELSGMDDAVLITDPYKLNNIDCVVIGTAHNCVLSLDWKLLKKIMNEPKLYDGRRGLNANEMSNYGWKYYAIGRPNEVIN